MNYQNHLPNKIVTRVMELIALEINITKLAEKVKKPVPSLWNKISNKRRWDAESWLKTLWSLGHVKYSEKRGKGFITIQVPMVSHEVAQLDKTRGKDIFISEIVGIKGKP